MTVQQLINKLQRFKRDAKVMIHTNDDTELIAEVTSVEEYDNEIYIE